MHVYTLTHTIDVYNALTVHGLCTASPLPSSVLELDHFWPHTAYNIGGHIFSLDDIEHGVLRGELYMCMMVTGDSWCTGNRPHPAANKPPFADDDPWRKIALKTCDARIHFALVCGAKVRPSYTTTVAYSLKKKGSELFSCPLSSSVMSSNTSVFQLQLGQGTNTGSTELLLTGSHSA